MEDSTFYQNYLGINHAETKGEILLCRSDMRDLPLNRHFVYKMIVTDYEGRRVLSLSNDFTDTNAEALCNEIAGKDLDDVYHLLLQQMTKYRTSFMYRMLRPEKMELKASMEPKEKHLREKSCTEETCTEEACKEIACIEEKNTKEGLTFVYMKEQRKQCAILQAEYIGYAKISDIYDGYGNIVVWVEENYRQRGIATILIHKLIQRCEEEGLIPMYLVKRENLASFRLAKKFGYEIVHREIILCQEI